MQNCIEGDQNEIFYRRSETYYRALIGRKYTQQLAISVLRFQTEKHIRYLLETVWKNSPFNSVQESIKTRSEFSNFVRGPKWQSYAPPSFSMVLCHLINRHIRRGLVVRISAFHAGGPGSIPGVGILFFFLLRNWCRVKNKTKVNMYVTRVYVYDMVRKGTRKWEKVMKIFFFVYVS